MKKLSLPLLSDTVISRRKGLKMTQAELAARTGINRSTLSKLESQEYTPSIIQLQALAEVLCFEPTDLFTDAEFRPVVDTLPSTETAEQDAPQRKTAGPSMPSTIPYSSASTSTTKNFTIWRCISSQC